MSLLPITQGILEVSGTATAQDVTAVVCNTKGAHGEYVNFAFNSLAIIGGVAYGCKATAVHSLTGSTDTGTAIDAAFLTGLTDFSDEGSVDKGMRQKRVESITLNARVERGLSIRVKIDEAKERLYPQNRTSKPGMSPLRQKIPQGIKGRNWQFGANNIAGSDFAADTMEILPVILSRSV